MKNYIFPILLFFAASCFAITDKEYSKLQKTYQWLGVELDVDWKSEEEYNKELGKYQKEAEDGNAEAMYRLGRLIETARHSVTSDYKNALKWYEKAVEKKHPGAMNHLANMYMTSQGVPFSVEKAVKLYSESANAGDTDAMTNLGTLHFCGVGFPKDAKEAVKLYEKAAEGGNTAAMNLLAAIYVDRYGDNPEIRDHKKIMPMCEKAAAAGSVTAMVNLGDIYYTGGGHFSSVKPDRKKAFDLYQKAMKRGSRDAISRITQLTMQEEDGIDDPKLQKLGEKMMKLAAVSMWGLDNMPGDDEDFEEIGELDLDERDDERTFNIFNNEIPLMDEGAYSEVGDDDEVFCILYEDGKTKFTKERCFTTHAAVKWYESEVEKGNVEAMYELGKLYSDGKVKNFSKYGGREVPHNEEELNYQKALPYLTKAAEKGHAEAMFEISKIYESKASLIEYYGNRDENKDKEAQKKEIEENKAKAKEWFKKATDKGSKRAKMKFERNRNLLSNSCIEEM